ncbi:MAG: hypothetical protein HY984_00615 [Candidatus Magasanikbacteria bacterium]|nr:hypothetical protein [Candidatus Magasanikbacteria bacterium]
MVFFQVFAHGVEDRIIRERAARDFLIDGESALRHDSSGANGRVADFGIGQMAFGQANRFFLGR